MTPGRSQAELLRHMHIEVKRIDSLRPNPNNPREHSKRQIDQIGESILAFGFVGAVVIDEADRIVIGNATAEAAKQRGMDSVPTMRLTDLTQEQIRALIVTHNRIAENATWNLEILANEFENLLALNIPDFDITVTGFEIPEIDAIIEDAKMEPIVEEAPLALSSNAKPVTHSGDVWLMNKHKLACGSALDELIYKELFGKRRAALVWTDPPYNMAIDRCATGNGSIHHPEFKMASGEMSDEEFSSFLNNSFALVSKYSLEFSVHYVCMDWRHAYEITAVGKKIYGRHLNTCVWVKNQPGMGSFYRSQHELIFVFCKGKGSHRNNIQLGKFGRNRSNVWEYPGIQTMSRQSDEGNLLALHPTVKPIAMVADVILDSSARGEIVLDAFLGSGTTLMAAERVGRICYGIEIDPLYVDTAIHRWQKYTGEAAIHAGTGRSFDEIVKEVSNA